MLVEVLYPFFIRYAKKISCSSAVRQVAKNIFGKDEVFLNKIIFHSARMNGTKVNVEIIDKGKNLMFS